MHEVNVVAFSYSFFIRTGYLIPLGKCERVSSRWMEEWKKRPIGLPNTSAFWVTNCYGLALIRNPHCNVAFYIIPRFHNSCVQCLYWQPWMRITLNAFVVEWMMGGQRQISNKPACSPAYLDSHFHMNWGVDRARRERRNERTNERTTERARAKVNKFNIIYISAA
jgi:hypothetical protein